jgi:transcription-repair coupling factor (superfamily II helicase)
MRNEIERYVGLFGAARAWLLARFVRDRRCVVILCKDRAAGEDLVHDLKFFLGGAEIKQLAAWDTLPFETVSPQTEVSAQRIETLLSLEMPTPKIIVAPAEALIQRIVPRAALQQLRFELTLGQLGTVAELGPRFRQAGYQEVSLVENLGDLAIRGQVIDFFPATSPLPVRIEFHGAEIQALRLFEPESQRSTDSLDRITVLPVRELPPRLTGAALHSATDRLKTRGKKLETPPREIARAMSALRTGTDYPALELIEAIGSPGYETFFDYLPTESSVIVCDELGIRQALDEYYELVEERGKRMAAEHYLVPTIETLYLTPAEVRAHISPRTSAIIDQLELLDDSGEGIDSRPPTSIQSFSLTELTTRLKSKAGSGKALLPLREKLVTWIDHGFSIAFVVGSPHRAERLQKLLLDIGIEAVPTKLGGLEWIDSPHRTRVSIIEGTLSAGFQLPREQLVFIAESEIFSERSHRRAKSRTLSIKKIMGTLAQLAEGDFIVHTDYGIGVYHGLKHLNIEGAESDFLHIEYADSKLYLPVQNIGKIQKFVAAEGQRPVLDKLGSTRWVKTRQKVRESVVALAGDLIKLYAQRSVAKGWRYEPFGAEDERFADGFAFEETPDQEAAIQDTVRDMASERPMDRLVCGDVGFGKTEVALRAGFKAVQHARQVAVLVPTTILVEQHRRAFAERLMGYDARVGAVSRFYSPAENRATLDQLAWGEIDIIVGTHRLLQRDVVFKDLGLVIIDEEHRFGVKQKERLKQMKKQVDVLSLTATPIPRTLHMSLLGIRDISVITTPPHDRKVVRTYTATHNDSIIRDAIVRELQRGGQSFFVHNRIDSLPVVTARLAELIPEARFEFAHGQMEEGKLEKIMHRFMQREFDVLVTTTIIESGLDLPNVNTIVIDRADMFGLAQLYQLRGRVGRSTRQAYAYFLVPGARSLGADAQKRLKVLQSLDDLGIGFNLAIRDLEIRGAGNLLGKEQSGTVLSVGFDLYSKILKEAVLNLKGEELAIEEVIDPEVKLGMPAFIPDAYVPDVSERLVLYQRLAAVLSRQEALDLGDEIEDRFGPMGRETQNLIELMAFRSLLRTYGIVTAEFAHGKLRLVFSPRAPIDATKMLALVNRNPARYKFSKNLTFTIELNVVEIDQPSQVHALTEEVLELIAAERRDVPRPPLSRP